MTKTKLPISFFCEDVEFAVPQQEKIKQWIARVIKDHHFSLIELSYIFCSDEYLHQMNVEYLNHDTYTDIITFDNSEESETVEGDIFISIDRVKENAATMGVEMEEELYRVMIHGVLHLLGFDDHTPEEKAAMRAEEDMCINLLKQS